MSRMIFAGLAPAMLLCAAPAANAQMLMQGNISADQALTIVHRAIDACRDASVSITVLDRDGNIRLQVRGNGANPHNLELSRRKAYTARTFRMTTEDFVKEMASRPVRREQTTLPHVIAIPGGVPIKVGNDVIGGIGLSGSPGVDEPCVRAGLDKVADQLR
jgi:uncharacterized protein GlcG (DUF336 family)